MCPKLAQFCRIRYGDGFTRLFTVQPTVTETRRDSTETRSGSPGTYPFSSDQGSQTGLGSTSTRLSDCPGTLSAVVFMNKPHNGARQPVLLPILFLPFYLPSYLLPFHLQLAWPSMQTQSVWLHSAWHATGL